MSKTPPREVRGQGAAWIRATRHLALGFQLTLSQSSVTQATDNPGTTDPMCGFLSPGLNLILKKKNSQSELQIKPAFIPKPAKQRWPAAKITKQRSQSIMPEWTTSENSWDYEVNYLNPFWLYQRLNITERDQYTPSFNEILIKRRLNTRALT